MMRKTRLVMMNLRRLGGGSLRNFKGGLRKRRGRGLRRLRRRAIIRVILTPEARSRLDNLRLVKPELVESIENQLITLAQSGRIKVPITDEELKKILEAVYNQTRREYRIRFR